MNRTNFLGLLCAVLSTGVSALESVHYPIGPITSNLAVGADHAIWYAGFGTLARVAKDGTLTVFPVGTNLEFDFIALGPDGNIWAASRSTDAIFAITPSGVIAHSFTVPDVFHGAMAAGADGRLWISSETSMSALDTQGHVTNYNVPEDSGAIAAGPDGNMWSASSSILRVSPSGSASPYSMPMTESGPTSGYAIVAGPDGKMWIAGDHFGCAFSPCFIYGAVLVAVASDGSTTTYEPSNSIYSSVSSLAFGADGKPWLTGFTLSDLDSSDGRSVLLHMTSDGVFTSHTVDGYPSSLVNDTDGNLWFVDIYNLQITKVAIAADFVFSDPFDAL